MLGPTQSPTGIIVKGTKIAKVVKYATTSVQVVYGLVNQLASLPADSIQTNFLLLTNL